MEAAIIGAVVSSVLALGALLVVASWERLTTLHREASEAEPLKRARLALTKYNLADAGHLALHAPRFDDRAHRLLDEIRRSGRAVHNFGLRCVDRLRGATSRWPSVRDAAVAKVTSVARTRSDSVASADPEPIESPLATPSRSRPRKRRRGHRAAAKAKRR